MKIYALLSYWDEDPDHLRRCVGSLAGFCDHLIAVDGPYATFSPTRAYGAADQAAAIRHAARSGGVGVEVRLRATPWLGGEVDKRATMFAYGRAAGATPEDWFLIIDADMALAEFTPDARDRLAATDRDVAEVRWHDVQIDGKTCSTHRFRSMFRALPGLTVERTHFLYTVPDDASRAGRRFLWHVPSGHISDEPALDLFDGVTLHHFNSSRDPDRRQRALDYYKDRDARGLEAAGRDWTGLGELA